jgi:hypothetical protein
MGDQNSGGTGAGAGTNGDGGAGAGAGGAGAGAGTGGSLMTSAPAAGGTQFAKDDWRSSLPPEMQGLPAIRDYKDVPSLVKSHVNLQTMIGSDKVVLPNDKSTPEQLTEFYKKWGRPETAEGYKFPPVKLPNGAEVPKEVMSHFMGVFHKAGLSQKQAEQVFSEYMNHEGTTMANRQTAIQTSQKAALEKLKTDMGDAYEEHVTAAQVLVKTFGNPELNKWLEDTGLGNDANFVRFFGNIAKSVMDDKAIVGGGGVQFKVSPEQAKDQITALKKDKDFVKALTTKTDPGHKEARAKWDELHSKAFGNALVKDN